MAQLIPDHLLETLLCSQCHKYLSILPVKSYKDRTVKCGRCCGYNDDGVCSQQYENVMKICLFKCINRYDGCRQILKTSDVHEHEKNCKSTDHNCLENGCDFSGSLFDLIQHYTITHPDHIIRSSCIDVDISDCDVKLPTVKTWLMVLSELDIVLVVDITIHAINGSIMFLAKTLKLYDNLFQSFSITVFGEHDIFNTESKPCLSVNDVNENYSINFSLEATKRIRLNLNINSSKAALYVYKFPSSLTPENNTSEKSSQKYMYPVVLSPQFKEMYSSYRLSPDEKAFLVNCSGQRIEILCSNCELYMGYYVFVCENLHYLCYDCSELCLICDSNMIKFDQTTSLQNSLLLFLCKWKCGEYLTAKEKSKHELSCSYYLLKCFVCSLFYPIQEFIRHTKDEHVLECERDIHTIDKYIASQKRFIFISEKHGFVLLFSLERRKIFVVEAVDDKIKLQFLVLESLNSTIISSMHIQEGAQCSMCDGKQLKFFIRKIPIKKTTL